MSANATGTASDGRGRKKVNPNETPGQKLNRRAGSAVDRVVAALKGLGNVGVDIKEYCKATGADPSAILNQINSVLQGEFKTCAVKLQTGESQKTQFQLEGIQ